MIKNKAIGFYLVLLASVLGIISVIRYFLWAATNDSLDYVIIISFVIGILFNTLLMLKENDFAMILTTTCYSIAGVKILTNSVGSFVDALQGINMFGDATQVGNIIAIVVFVLLAIILSMIVSFTTLSKSE